METRREQNCRHSWKERVGGVERVAWKHITLCEIANGYLLYDAGSSNPMLWDNLEGWNGEGGGKEVQKGGDICILWLIHVEV